MSRHPKQLRWMCRRGLKELDDLLLDYLDRAYPAAPAENRRAFEQLLELENTDLLELVFGSRSATDAPTIDVIKQLGHRSGD